MKAAVRRKYGGPDVLIIAEVEKPVPRRDEVLVKVVATTVNRSDYHVLTGKPWFMRFFTGLSKPTLHVTGSDFVGYVEAVGKDVTTFKGGQRVMGFIDMGSQSHAEYLVIKEPRLTLAPSNLRDEEVPACLEGAFYALCAVNALDLRAGQKAMVLGATGAIGTSYAQLLRSQGLDVTAVCAGEHGALVRSLGAARIIDYTTSDFTKDTGRYDFVIDAVGKYSFKMCKHLLTEKGIYTSSHPNIFQALFTPLVGGKKELFPIPKDLIRNLARIRDLVERGEFRPVIDKTLPLDDISEAYSYVGSGRKIGNVIIRIGNP